MSSVLNIGLDVGSTTVKIIVLDNNENVVYKKYLRHFSNIKDTVLMMLDGARTTVQGHLLTLMVTGSGGYNISQKLEVPFIQEVIGLH